MGVVEVLSKAVATDEVAGCALIDSVVYDFVADLAEVNRDAISGEIGIWALDRVQVAKRALGRSYVDTVSKGMYPEDDVQLAATWLAGLESYITAAVSGEFSKSGKGNEWCEPEVLRRIRRRSVARLRHEADRRRSQQERRARGALLRRRQQPLPVHPHH